MGQKRQYPPCETMDLQYAAISIKVEVTAPDDAPIFPQYMRSRFKCRLIDQVEQGGVLRRVDKGGLKTVIIYAQDCTAIEAVAEYQRIINEQRGYHAEQIEHYHEDEEGEEHNG